MSTETSFRIAFLILFVILITMRVYFMVRVRRSGGRIMPDGQAVAREGGRGVLVIRVIGFFALMIFLVMYFLGANWIDAFSFPLPGWLRWTGFALGVVAVIFWTWTQVTLDTQWSAQLQLTKDHHLITTGPYALIRHPLYAGIFGWCVALPLLTANWILLLSACFQFSGCYGAFPKKSK
jgi:protein-S-isoprenylcysteine O-methyltransferase Ste14